MAKYFLQHYAEYSIIEMIKIICSEGGETYKRWAREPQIRKYDHIYNGTLSLGINDKRRFRDSKVGLIEERLGEALIAIFYCINEAKLAREEREEAERKREEERRRQEERRERYNQEVDRTNALVNQANDFEIATKIRAMVAAADDFFGKRNHKDSPDSKTPSKRWSSYRW